MLRHSIILIAFLATACDCFSTSSRSRYSWKCGASSESLSSLEADSSKTELDLSKLQGFCQTAEMAARAAGKIIAENLGCASEMGKEDQDEEYKIKTNIKDIVTQFDKQAQDAVESIIKKAYPSHSFLGEEDVDAGAAASETALQDALRNSDEFLWIIDPIDGTGKNH